MNSYLHDFLSGIVSSENVLTDEPMSKHTTFKVGGPAKAFVCVKTKEQLKELLKYIKKSEMPFFILGNGSNILVSDKGFDGIVLSLSSGFDQIRTEGTRIYAQAGVTMGRLSAEALTHSLTGLEFASGIPGTLGGGMVMNAGAYGGEFKDVTELVSVCDMDGNFMDISNEDMHFGYRTSIIKGRPLVVTDVVVNLKEGDKDEIKETMSNLAAKRMEKQPLEYPSAGSTFKRPEGYFAGKLISDAGLGGYSVGDAQVSEKHNGFIINRGNASAADIKKLIEHVRSTVFENSGVMLEPEVIFLGDFEET